MKWLFLVHQVRTNNSRERVKVWRLTKKVGAILYRNSVYVLPHSRERLEDFHWLCQQIRDSKGEASVFLSESNDTHENKALKEAFEFTRGHEYAELGSRIDAFISRFQKTISTEVVSAAHQKALEKDLRQLEAEFLDIRRVDFFGHPMAAKIEKRLTEARQSLAGLEKWNEPAPVFTQHKRSEFSGKTWATRPRIHIDRLCSAWLIKRFIDPKARFVFAPEEDLPKNAIPFDVFGVEFSHRGDRCTFETLLEAFQVRNKSLSSLAELVHEIDLKDDKFSRSESSGLDLVVRSLSDSLQNDHKTLEFGSRLLDAIYDQFSHSEDR